MTDVFRCVLLKLMPKLSERGAAHLLVLVILLLGLVAAVYLTTSGNPLKLFSSAVNSPIVFKSLNGNPLPITKQGVTQTTSPIVRVELTSTLGPPMGLGSGVSRPVKTGTAFYRTGFDLNQLQRTSFVPYRQEPTTFNVFINSTKGIQFYWVEFKGTDGRIDRRSAQIQVVPIGGTPTSPPGACTVNWLSVPNNPAPNTDVIIEGREGSGDFQNVVFSIDGGSWRNDFASVSPDGRTGTIKMNSGAAGSAHTVRVGTNSGSAVCTPNATFITSSAAQVCTPGSYNARCSGRCNGCASNAGEQTVKQCNSQGSGWNPEYGQCSTDCAGPCQVPIGGTPTPLPTTASVVISSPAAGSYYFSGTNITISANVFDQKGIQRIEFYFNNQLINYCTQYNPSYAPPYSCNYTLPNLGFLTTKTIMVKEYNIIDVPTTASVQIYSWW